MHNMGKGDRKKILGRAKRARKAGRIPLQYGALCFRNTPKGIRILLVTSRRSKRWISPKGWPMPGKTPAETAAEEAWEEAGVRGTPIPHSLGFYRYRKFIDRKTNITCTVQVFPVLVTEQVRRFPEHGERRRLRQRGRKIGGGSGQDHQALRPRCGRRYISARSLTKPLI